MLRHHWKRHTTEGEKVRPTWKMVPPYTIKVWRLQSLWFARGVSSATLRRTALKSAMDGVLWIYQKKSNNVNDLNSHIWIHGLMVWFHWQAYGYQVGQVSTYSDGDYDQMDRDSKDLKESRSAVVLWQLLPLPIFLRWTSTLAHSTQFTTLLRGAR